MKRTVFVTIDHNCIRRLGPVGRRRILRVFLFGILLYPIIYIIYPFKTFQFFPWYAQKPISVVEGHFETEFSALPVGISIENVYERVSSEGRQTLILGWTNLFSKCPKNVILRINSSNPITEMKVGSVIYEKSFGTHNDYIFKVYLPQGFMSSKKTNKFKICGSGKCKKYCSQATSQLDMSLMRTQDSAPILYIDFRKKSQTGGPESLHRIHQAVNMLHSGGKVKLRSVFPTNVRVYQTEFSDYLDPSSNWVNTIENQSYVLFPEGQGPSAAVQTKIDQRLIIPLTVYLGQHTDDLRNVKATQKFKPICLTHYFEDLYFCSKHAKMDTPMNSKFIELSSSQDWSQDLKTYILYDPDSRFNISKVEVPAGYSLKALSGMNFTETVMHFKASIIYIDSFLTGRERALFEASLFDVIPIVGYHAGANNPIDYPMPTKWKWNLFDYSHLNALIRMAIKEPAQALADFESLRLHVRSMEQEFYRDVNEYFAHDYAIVLSAFSKIDGPLFGMYSALAIINAIIIKDWFPLATTEIFTADKFYFQFEYADLVRDWKDNHHAYDTVISELNPSSSVNERIGMLSYPLTFRSERVLFVVGKQILHSRGFLNNLMQSLEVYDFVYDSGLIAARQSVLEHVRSFGPLHSLGDVFAAIEDRFRILIRNIDSSDVEHFGLRKQECKMFTTIHSENYWRRYTPFLRRNVQVKSILENLEQYCTQNL